MAAGRDSFHWVDYVIFAFMLSVSCGIGIYYALTGNKLKTKNEFLMGNRNMKWIPVALSILVSFNSGILLLGEPAEVYQYGIQYWIGVIGTSFSAFLAAMTFLPLLYRLQLTSSYEYLELRFQSKAVRILGTLLIITSQVIYMGIATFSPAIALEAVTGFPVWLSILCVGAVATFYTSLGGMKAVIWTDAFQSVIMIGGMVAIVVTGTIKVGGFSALWNINKDNGRLNLFDFNPDPLVRLSFWSLVFGQILGWLPFYGVNQTAVQRYCSLPSLNKARMALLVNVPSQMMMTTLSCATGLVIYSYFSQCDPLEHPDLDQRIGSPNQLVPYFVMQVLGWPGVPGIFVSSLFSGSLSTVSSCLNALAAVTWEDLLKWKFDYLTEKTKTVLLKILVLLYGLSAIAMAFMATLLRGSVLQASLSFMATSSSPLLGLFILGAFFTRSNWLGAIIGGVVGLALPMWMSLGSYISLPAVPPLDSSTAQCVWNETLSAVNTTLLTTSLSTDTTVLPPVEGLNKLYSVSFMWFPTIGVFTTVLIGLIISFLTAPIIKSPKSEDIEDRYLILACDRFSWFTKAKKKEKYALSDTELVEFTPKVNGVAYTTTEEENHLKS